MRIDEQLRLVTAVEGDIRAYHVPLPRDVFEANYRLLASTKAAMMAKGAAFMADAGPRIATLLLKDEARADREDSEAAVTSLLQDIQRLTTVLVPTPNGWEQLPVQTAITRQAIDAESWAEVESSLLFFTCHSCMSRRMERAGVMKALALIVGGEITSSSITDYLASLPTSTATSGTQKPASSVPS
ncbi:MAG TPA: hypothetical protein VN731_10030 [Rhodanobacter sp.]|nr:hypothetical protein [Rhodanobacter sp.]